MIFHTGYSNMRHYTAALIAFMILAVAPRLALPESACVPLKQRALQDIQRGKNEGVPARLHEAFTIGHRDSDYPCAVVSVVTLYGWLMQQGRTAEARRYAEYITRVGTAERHMLRRDPDFHRVVGKLRLPAHVLQAEVPRPALHQALIDRRFDEAARLVSDKTQVQARDAEGRTALHWAATMGSVDLVERLLKAGLTVDVRDAHGRTALGEASFHGHAGVVRLLLKRGADPNAADPIGGSPLIFAALRNHGEVVTLLTGKGANPNQADKNGATPLMMAAYKGHLDIVERLLKAGADRHRRDGRGANAFDYARSGGRRDIMERLMR